jgi:hypothetical protein
LSISIGELGFNGKGTAISYSGNGTLESGQKDSESELKVTPLRMHLERMIQKESCTLLHTMANKTNAQQQKQFKGMPRIITLRLQVANLPNWQHYDAIIL